MSGRFSREKGRRGEQNLVLYLKKKYFAAERILRQYQFSGQPDVKATKHEKTTTFELKCRRSAYEAIYDLYYARREAGRLCFIDGPLGLGCALGTDVEDLLTINGDVRFMDIQKEKLPPAEARVFKKILKLNELRQSADILVLKDNNKPWMFVRYY